MNMKGLARVYDKLTAWERVPLILAAHQRGDEAEGERLARAAPVNTFRVADHYGLSEGLRLLATAVRLDQLDLAAFSWRLETFIADWSAGPPDRATETQVTRLENIRKWLAFRFLVITDGWKLLCAELHLEPDFPERYLPEADQMAHMEAEARELAFTHDEALAHLRRQVEASEPAEAREPEIRRTYRIDTAADVAQTMREYLDDHRKSWA